MRLNLKKIKRKKWNNKSINFQFQNHLKVNNVSKKSIRLIGRIVSYQLRIKLLMRRIMKSQLIIIIKEIQTIKTQDMKIRNKYKKLKSIQLINKFKKIQRVRLTRNSLHQQLESLENPHQEHNSFNNLRSRQKHSSHCLQMMLSQSLDHV